MGINNHAATRNARYIYGDYTFCQFCTTLRAHFLDEPIGEAVISQLSFGDLADKLLDELVQDYEQAQNQVASYRREMRRLESEVTVLRTNLASEVMSSEQLQWLDTQIQHRLGRIRELTDLQLQPIGAAVGQSVPGKDDIELVRDLLTDLGETWKDQPNGLKNTLLHLLLDRVTIWAEPKHIRAKLTWRTGCDQEILIRRPGKGPTERWSEAEKDLLREHYETATKDELLEMLPGRTWKAIKLIGSQRLGLSRGQRGSMAGPRYNPKEDELVRRYYAGEITRDDVLATGRSLSSITQRGRYLGWACANLSS